MASGQIFNGTVIIQVYNNQTIENPTESKQIIINLYQVQVAWNGTVPPLNDTKMLNFAFPAGFTVNYIYSYDLHGGNFRSN